MSRSQATQTFDTASSEQGTNFSNAQKNEQAAQEDIGQFQSALSKYAATNPYVQGGEYDTTSNRQLSNTADANANAERAKLQSLAQRTGQNPAAANAASEEIARQNERDLAGQEAGATKDRIASEAGYKSNVLSESAKPEQMEEQLAALQQGAAEGNLNAANAASAQNKSFGDMLGSDFAGALASWASRPGSGGASKV